MQQAAGVDSRKLNLVIARSPALPPLIQFTLTRRRPTPAAGRLKAPDDHICIDPLFCSMHAPLYIPLLFPLSLDAWHVGKDSWVCLILGYAGARGVRIQEEGVSAVVEWRWRWRLHRRKCSGGMYKLYQRAEHQHSAVREG